jgi:hypothetical protein
MLTGRWGVNKGSWCLGANESSTFALLGLGGARKIRNPKFSITTEATELPEFRVFLTSLFSERSLRFGGEISASENPQFAIRNSKFAA